MEECVQSQSSVKSVIKKIIFDAIHRAKAYVLDPTNEHMLIRDHVVEFVRAIHAKHETIPKAMCPIEIIMQHAGNCMIQAFLTCLLFDTDIPIILNTKAFNTSTGKFVFHLSSRWCSSVYAPFCHEFRVLMKLIWDQCLNHLIRIEKDGDTLDIDCFYSGKTVVAPIKPYISEILTHLQLDIMPDNIHSDTTLLDFSNLTSKALIDLMSAVEVQRNGLLCASGFNQLFWAGCDVGFEYASCSHNGEIENVFSCFTDYIHLPKTSRMKDKDNNKEQQQQQRGTPLYRVNDRHKLRGTNLEFKLLPIHKQPMFYDVVILVSQTQNAKNPEKQ